MGCGVNVSLTLRVLYRLTGNGPVQAPSKAIILRAARAKGACTRTQLARTKVLAVLQQPH